MHICIMIFLCATLLLAVHPFPQILVNAAPLKRYNEGGISQETTALSLFGVVISLLCVMTILKQIFIKMRRHHSAESANIPPEGFLNDSTISNQTSSSQPASVSRARFLQPATEIVPDNGVPTSSALSSGFFVGLFGSPDWETRPEAICSRPYKSSSSTTRGSATRHMYRLHSRSPNSNNTDQATILRSGQSKHSGTRETNSSTTLGKTTTQEGACTPSPARRQRRALITKPPNELDSHPRGSRRSSRYFSMPSIKSRDRMLLRRRTSLISARTHESDSSFSAGTSALRLTGTDFDSGAGGVPPSPRTPYVTPKKPRKSLDPNVSQSLVGFSSKTSSGELKNHHKSTLSTQNQEYKFNYNKNESAILLGRPYSFNHSASSQQSDYSLPPLDSGHFTSPIRGEAILNQIDGLFSISNKRHSTKLHINGFNNDSRQVLRDTQGTSLSAFPIPPSAPHTLPLRLGLQAAAVSNLQKTPIPFAQAISNRDLVSDTQVPLPHWWPEIKQSVLGREGAQFLHLLH